MSCWSTFRSLRVPHRNFGPQSSYKTDAINRRLLTTILAPITSNIRHQNEPTQIAVDPGSPDDSQTGLLRPSAIKCENLATVETRLVRRKIGVLSSRLQASLEIALKASLGIR